MISYSFDKIRGQSFSGSVKDCIKFILEKHNNKKQFWIRDNKGKEQCYLITSIIKYKAKRFL
jgi:hypothetical protein